MTDSYAPAKAAYRELRVTIGPWAKANGYRRWAGTQAGWQKPMDEQRLLFKFEGESFVNPDTGKFVPWPRSAGALGCPWVHDSAPVGSLTLPRPGRARPVGANPGSDQPMATVPALVPDEERRRGLILGHSLRELYEPAPHYREGQMISFSYFGLEDAREFAAFIAAVLPQALERFLQGHIAQPVDNTPPHLRPTWLTTLAKPGDG